MCLECVECLHTNASRYTSGSASVPVHIWPRALLVYFAKCQAELSRYRNVSHEEMEYVFRNRADTPEGEE